ncbi:MAG: helix-turn-helix transcriptional regulator, partial [Jiangellaceae bacterium]
MAATLNYVVTTGDYIAEWMEDEGINAAELARRLDVTPKHVSELLSGKAPLSHALSLALERVTGVPARIWNLYEAGYRSAVAGEAVDADLADQYEAAKQFPLAYLRKYDIIRAPARDHAGTVRE